MDIGNTLFALRDEGYRDFTSRLIPNIPKDRILGVRIPSLRRLSKDLMGSKDGKLFLETLPHRYLDEDNLHAIMISNMKDTNDTLLEIDRFLPHVDNWMTSDTMNPRSLKNDLKKTNEHAHLWLNGDGIYQRRYSITTFMKLFLDEDSLDSSAMDEIARIRDDDYYVKMASAWYWAEALYKCPDSSLPYIESNTLDPWIRLKAIQKARESKKIPTDLKTRLKDMK